MSIPDFNLLITLDVLLAEGSVARAADRLGLSPSAMRRALARLRATTGAPLLVPAGRGLVPTPRALALREQVRQLVHDGRAVLRPGERLNLKQLPRTFTMRTSDGFVERFGPTLLARVGVEAPGVRLRFVHKPAKDGAHLRDGTIDLETGVAVASTSPELPAQVLFRDRFVGVVRTGQALGLAREIVTIVGGFSTALALVRTSDLIAAVPDRHTGTLRTGLHSFARPFATPEITMSLLWHPRLDTDFAHRWLRGCVRDACAVRGPRSR